MEINLAFLIFQLLVLIFSVMIHEISHGYVAERLGDQTAKLAGRLTLNPLKHIDPIGSIILPVVLFLSGANFILGWAKPVPYNPYNLKKDMKYGPLKVALAGPASNLLVLIVLGVFARLGAGYLDPTFIGLMGFIAMLNISLAFFNLIPIPPLDGSKILTLILPRRYALILENFSFYGIFIVFGLLLFFPRFFSYISYLAALLFYAVAGGEVFAITQNLLGSFGGGG